MNAHWRRFNLYLAMLLALGLIIGCKTDPEAKKKKQFCVLRVHLEVPPDGTDRSQQIEIMKKSPLRLNVEKYPLLLENQLAHAKIYDATGGFALRLEYGHVGTRVLEQATAANRGSHLAIFACFGEPMTNNRWLGAPLISKIITNGIIDFTPDATREEVDQIVIGINNDVEEYGSKLDREPSL